MLFLFQRIEQRRLEHKVGFKKMPTAFRPKLQTFLTLCSSNFGSRQSNFKKCCKLSKVLNMMLQLFDGLD